jgi:FAD/FMN-containing dehydrogenase
VGAGAALISLKMALAGDRYFFPPVPTFLGATVGGAVSTNAAGAATFKYGSTRPWVEALTVVARGTNTGASGLGLAIVKRIVERHGGTIEVSSTLDEGAEFRIWMPVHQQAPKAN